MSPVFRDQINLTLKQNEPCQWHCTILANDCTRVYSCCVSDTVWPERLTVFTILARRPHSPSQAATTREFIRLSFAIHLHLLQVNVMFMYRHSPLFMYGCSGQHLYIDIKIYYFEIGGSLPSEGARIKHILYKSGLPITSYNAATNSFRNFLILTKIAFRLLSSYDQLNFYTFSFYHLKQKWWTVRIITKVMGTCHGACVLARKMASFR